MRCNDKENSISIINVQRLFEVPEINSIINTVKEKDDKRTLWGVAPIAPLHFGYDSLILLQKALINIGCSHTILLSDLHAMMSHGFTFEDVTTRCNYYSYYFSRICGLNADILRGSFFQTRPGYIEDLYDALSILHLSKLKKSFPISRKNEPVLAYMVIYTIMQCIDCYHTPTRIIIAEEGQKKVYRLIDYIKDAEKKRKKEIWLLSLRERMKTEIFFYYLPTSHDLLGKPLIYSNANTRISIHESSDSLKKKITKMYAPPGKQKLNGSKINALLEFYKYSVFPWNSDSIKVNTKEGLAEYEHYADFEKDYNKELIHPQDAKETLYNELLSRINIIQDKFNKGLTYWIDLQKAIGGYD